MRAPTGPPAYDGLASGVGRPRSQAEKPRASN